MLEVWKKQFTWDLVLLRHKNRTVFVKSQWQKDNACSLWYLIYRWLSTIFFFVTWVFSILDVKNVDNVNSYNTKWLIYLTNWGYTLCMLQSLACTLMVSSWYIRKRKDYDNDIQDDPTLYFYQVYWAMNIIATDIALGITFLYWTVIYDASTMPLDAMNIFVHGTNSVLMMFELLLTAHPVRIVHCYWPVFFGLIYVIFSAIYFLAGGTAKDEKTYIYPILDWNKPGMTVLVCFGVLIFLITLHSIVYGIYRGRTFLHGKLEARQESKDVSPSHQINKGFVNDVV